MIPVRKVLLPSAAALVLTLLSGPAQADEAWAPLALPDLRDISGVTDLAAPATDQVWITGYQAVKPGYPGNPVLRRWTGSRWANHTAPGFSSGGMLESVSAAGPADVWVGGRQNSEGYAARWDGARWSKVGLPLDVSSPKPEAGPAGTWVQGPHNTIDRYEAGAWVRRPIPVSKVRGLNARTATDAWAVGAGVSDDDTFPSVAHWDGTSWTSLPLPDPHSEGAVIEDVLPVAADDVWFAGTNYTRGEPRSTEPILYRWNGSSLASVPLPADILSVSGVVADSTGTIWVSGQSLDTPDQIAALRYDGNQFVRTSTPTAAGFVVRFEGRDQLAAIPGTTSLWLLGTASPGGPFLYTLH
jgi:hypothetical protein